MILMKTIKGFTLIEVMVALAVFAIAMISLMSAMQSSAHNLEGLRNRTIAQWIVSNRFVGIESTGNVPTESNKIEKLQFGGVDSPREWVVRIQVIKTGMGNIRDVRISAGEPGEKEPNYYATMDGFFNVDH